MAFQMPDELSKPLKCDPNLRNFVKHGPRTGTGREQRVFSDAGYMTIKYDFYLRTPNQVRAWRWMIARLRAGEEMIARIMERSDPLGVRSLESEAELKNAAALRDTELDLYVTGINVRPGAFIGIANHAYVITDVVDAPENPRFFNPISGDGPWIDDLPWSDVEPTQQSWTVKILPPLRNDYDAGAAVKFTGITMVGVIEDPAQGDTDLDLIRRGNVSVTIIESI